MIIFRYLAKEIYLTLVTITLVLVFVFLCNALIHLLGMVSDGKVAVGILFHLLMFKLPELLGVLMPLGLYLGVLWVYSRLYSDSEMTVLFATGMTARQLIWMTSKIALGVVFVTLLLMMWVNPILAFQRDILIQKEGRNNVIATLVPGKFHEIHDSVYYVENIGPDNKVRNLFVAKAPETHEESLDHPEKKWMIITAMGGYQKTDKDTGVDYVVGTNGNRYIGVPGEHAFQVVHFKEYGLQANQHVARSYRIDENDMSLTMLWHAVRDGDTRERNNAIAELQWRLSIPLSALILAILAVPLSKVNPRQGRFMLLVPAILINIVYANLLFVGRAWIESGTISPWIGMWWIHGLALLLAIVLIKRRFGGGV